MHDQAQSLYSRRRRDIEAYIRRASRAYVQVWQEDDGDEYIATGTDLSLNRLADWLCSQTHWEPIDALDDGQVVFYIPRVALCA